MREICNNYLVFIPEYTITSKTLKNIANAEYAKAIIENTAVLPNMEKQLIKDTKVRRITNSLLLTKVNIHEKEIKKYIDGIAKPTNQHVANINNCLNYINENIRIIEIDEEFLKNLHKMISAGILSENKQGTYRSNQIAGKTDPEILLAQIVEIFDWYQSIDSKSTHPIIISALLKAHLENLAVFDELNSTVLNMLIYTLLATSGYNLKNYICLEEYFVKTKPEYNKLLANLSDNEFTEWIEYFTQGFASEAMNAKERVLLMEKDTKIAKVSGRTKLTPRQQRVLEYLQDYGSLRNADFTTIFPDISEDSVLRDLKVLILQSLVVKTGSTKSSRYELR